VGFGGLLAIVLLMAWEGSRVVGVIEGEGNRLRATYQQRDELLDGIRFALSESASDIRDYLADRNVSAVPSDGSTSRNFVAGSPMRSPGTAAIYRPTKRPYGRS
jgi:hypothetical protein